MANAQVRLENYRRQILSYAKIIIGFAYLMIGTPGSKSKIIAFVIHEVDDTPNGHARLTHTCISKANFLDQISSLSDHFEFLNPATDPHWHKKSGCLITFDDGYRGSLNATKNLEAQGIASIHFLNLETITGKINSSTLIHYKSFKSGKQVDWSKSTPEIVERLTSELTETELQDLIEFAGPYLDTKELEELQSLTYVVVGDHFLNHWYGNSLSEIEVVENLSLVTNDYSGTIEMSPYFAAPHGVLDLCKIKIIGNQGYEVIFSGHRWTNVGNTTIIPRIDLNDTINSKYSLFGAIAVLVLKSKLKSRI
jgi:hypothetical protein